jgi:hypothetical protein
MVVDGEGETLEGILQIGLGDCRVVQENCGTGGALFKRTTGIMDLNQNKEVFRFTNAYLQLQYVHIYNFDTSLVNTKVTNLVHTLLSDHSICNLNCIN